MWACELGWRRLRGVTTLAALLCALLITLWPAPPARADAKVTTTGTPAAGAAGAAVPLSHQSAPATAASATATTTTTQQIPSTSPQQVLVQVASTPTTQPLGTGFLGFSIEFDALHAYLGRNPNALNPVFLQLLTGIDQGHTPILRVGGNSTDDTWLPLPGVLPPLGVNYTITNDWLATVRALVRRTGTRLILGVNLAADDPQMTTVEARVLVDAIGRRYIEDLEVGNEPDLYLRYPWFTFPNGTAATRRSGSYSYRDYATDFTHLTAVLPRVPLATGVFAMLNWLPNLVPAARSLPGVSMVTAHRYPLTNCGVAPSSPLYPTVSNLLSDASTSGLASPLGPYARELHAENINFRIDELNSASCEGAPGVSNTFASALWVLDTLFNMAGAGVDGVNIHTLPGSNYAPFSFNESRGGHWTASVHPLYYGLLFFARAFPTGAEMLTASDSSSDNGGDVKAYSTLAPDGTVRTTLINEDASRPAVVQLTLPSSTPLTEQTLTAAQLTATAGVTLGGRSFAEPTSTGSLAAPISGAEVDAGPDGYSVAVPAGSAVLLTGTP